MRLHQPPAHRGCVRLHLRLRYPENRGRFGRIEPFDLGDGQRRPLHLGTRLDLPDQGMSDLEIIIVVGNLVVPRQDGRSRR